MPGKAPAGGTGERAGVSGQLGDELRVVGWGADDGNVFKVLGGGAEHRRAADVDVLDQFGGGDAGLGGGLLEGVQIDDDHVDGLDGVGLDGGGVLGVGTNVEDAAVDLGMQRLDAAVEHLREAGEVGDVAHREAGFAEHSGGAAR